MAETPENNEASADEVGRGSEAVPETPASEEVETTTAAPEEPTAETTEDAPAAEAPAPAATPKAGATRREKLDAKRAERRVEAGKRPSRTPEERNAERLAERKRKAAERSRYRARVKAKKAEQRKAQPAPEADHAPEHGPGRAKVRQGVVVSDKGEKTIVVRLDVVRSHRRYHKILRSTQTLAAHDERNDAHPGDTVRVQECRPMSRTKRWRLLDVLERAK
jgi:small subunit ribosomal protein S17